MGQTGLMNFRRLATWKPSRANRLTFSEPIKLAAPVTITVLIKIGGWAAAGDFFRPAVFALEQTASAGAGFGRKRILRVSG
jgi:hypothetical protein